MHTYIYIRKGTICQRKQDTAERALKTIKIMTCQMFSPFSLPLGLWNSIIKWAEKEEEEEKHQTLLVLSQTGVYSISA